MYLFSLLVIIIFVIICCHHCHRQPQVQAPHLTALAARALVFHHAYCQQAVCSPSRNSFMTGRRPNSTRVSLSVFFVLLPSFLPSFLASFLLPYYMKLSFISLWLQRCGTL